MNGTNTEQRPATDEGNGETVDPNGNELLAVIEAAKKSNGRYVLPSDRLPMFMQILRKGGTHVLKNSRQEDGSFKNQAQFLTDGRPLHIDIFTSQVLTV